MKIILSHPTGNSNVRAIITALLEAKLLFRFYTCVALFQNSLIYNLLKFGPLKEFRKRSFSPTLKTTTQVRPFKEMGRVTIQKFGLQKLFGDERGIFSIDSVYRDLDQHTSQNLIGINAIYAYEDGALESFKEARSKSIIRLYDLPTGYWRAHGEFLEREKQLHPEWVSTMTCLRDSQEKLARKDEELSLASAIFVASNFTKQTLDLYPGNLAPVYLVPYGFPRVCSHRSYHRSTDAKIKLLFVGGLTQLKGLANLFEAVEFFKDLVELTVVGRKVTNDCSPLEEGLKKHTWIPALPHNEVLDLMRSHDLFVFPSLFEGYGLVIAEAMSQGTPVITTKRTCGADFITDDVNGWLVDAGDTNDLIQKLDSILSRPDSIERVGKAAMETAKAYPMTGYGEKMVNSIEDILKTEDVERKN